MAVRADDARHSVLGKARPLSQLALGQELLPRAEYGTYEVREVEVKTALTKCAMPGEPWTVNPYTGCSHDCAYCYVPDVAHVERPKWGSYVVVKRNLPTVLAREVGRKEKGAVFFSSATDCYQPAEATHKITRASLEILARHDWPVYVLTRNPLVKRDVPLFRRFSEFQVGMSVPTLDEEARRLVEPGAPTIEARLRTLRELADEGFATFANMMPCYPLTGGWSPDDVAHAFREAGVQEVHAGAFRYLASFRQILWRRVQGTDHEAIVDAIGDPRFVARMLRSLEKAFERARVPFHVAYPEPALGPHMMRW
jgi:DNA repair photolyase